MYSILGEIWGEILRREDAKDNFLPLHPFWICPLGGSRVPILTLAQAQSGKENGTNTGLSILPVGEQGKLHRTFYFCASHQ